MIVELTIAEVEMGNTVWKFHNFHITQIFREIIFRNFEGPKTAILTHLEALNFDFFLIFAFSEG